MVDQSMTPEEQLLRLIESGGKAEPGKKESKGFAFLNLKAWAGLFSGSGVKAKQPSRVRLVSRLVPRELSLKLVNRLLIVLLVFVLAGIAYNMNKVRATVENLSGQVAASRPSAGAQQALASLNPLADYLKEFEKRDLFRPVIPPKPKEKEAKTPESKKKQPVKKPPQPTSIEILKKQAKTLKLVGISWGKNPVAMIEDTTSRETSFLKAGQFINEIQVKVIMKDRAILSLGEAEYDLF
jgi:hypothetical protein